MGSRGQAIGKEAHTRREVETEDRVALGLGFKLLGFMLTLQVRTSFPLNLSGTATDAAETCFSFNSLRGP